MSENEHPDHLQLTSLLQQAKPLVILRVLRENR
jgi:hypothetical protein